MKSQEALKKALERSYLDCYLRLSKTAGIVDPREAPDFLVHDGKISFGVEVVRLFDDESASGSAKKREESGRERFLVALAKAFYTSGGKPTGVQAMLPSRPSKRLLQTMVLQLRAARDSLEDWGQRRITIGRPSSGTWMYLRALPVEMREYRNWTSIGDAVGWVKPAARAVLQAKIDQKAELLPRYKAAAKRVKLLIVADHTKNSGKFRVDAKRYPLKARGFAEVTLLLYPISVHRIA